MDEAHRVERPVAALLLADPVGRARQDTLVDEDEVSGLGERLEDERRESEVALVVLIAKRREAPVGALVR